jgi:hypothetical protein
LWRSKVKAKDISDFLFLGTVSYFLYWKFCVLVMQFIWCPVIVSHMWQLQCDINTLLSVLIIAHNYDNNEYLNWVVHYVTIKTREDVNGTTICVCVYVCVCARVHVCIKHLVLCLSEVYCVYGTCVDICLTKNVKTKI